MRKRIQDSLTAVTGFVIDAGVGLHLVREGIEVNPGHELLAPTPFRSQTLSLAYESAMRGEIPAHLALAQLETLWQ